MGRREGCCVKWGGKGGGQKRVREGGDGRVVALETLAALHLREFESNFSSSVSFTTHEAVARRKAGRRAVAEGGRHISLIEGRYQPCVPAARRKAGRRAVAEGGRHISLIEGRYQPCVPAARRKEGTRAVRRTRGEEAHISLIEGALASLRAY